MNLPNDSLKLTYMLKSYSVVPTENLYMMSVSGQLCSCTATGIYMDEAWSDELKLLKGTHVCRSNTHPYMKTHVIERLATDHCCPLLIAAAAAAAAVSFVIGSEWAHCMLCSRITCSAKPPGECH